jgi:hypothetical protein
MIVLQYAIRKHNRIHVNPAREICYPVINLSKQLHALQKAQYSHNFVGFMHAEFLVVGEDLDCEFSSLKS